MPEIFEVIKGEIYLIIYIWIICSRNPSLFLKKKYRDENDPIFLTSPATLAIPTLGLQLFVILVLVER